MKSIAWKSLAAGLVLSAVTLTALAQQEKPGRRRGGDAPPKDGPGASKKGGPAGKGQGQGQMQGRGGMSMFKVGAVIPPFMVGQLDLSEKQQAEINKLEAEVASKLKTILNDEQFEMLSQPPRMMNPGGFGPGGGQGGRGFGPGGPGGPDGRGFGPGGPGGRGGEEGGPPPKGGRGKGEPRRKPAPPPEDQ